MSPAASATEQKSRIIQVFEFLKAYADLKYPPVTLLSQHPSVLWLNSELPSCSEIQLFRSPPKDDPDNEDVILKVFRPVSLDCPTPPAELRAWLKSGWDHPSGAVDVKERIEMRSQSSKATIEEFTRHPELQSRLAEWTQRRDLWAEQERPARKAMDVFSKIYSWHGTLEREGEKMELVLGDGTLTLGKTHKHPILLQSLELEFFPAKSMFVIRRRESPPELYAEFLRSISGANGEQIRKCTEEQRAAEFTPLGDKDTSGFFKRLIQGLFPEKGVFISGDDEHLVTELQALGSDDSPFISRDPVIFLRQRRTGPSSVYQNVLEDIANRGDEDFSPGLLQILGMADAVPTNRADPSTERAVSFAPAEDEVLLAKPANRQQIEIAQRLPQRNCVLVQGPPGTGKTHTIANLLGHLLAQGKRVLVTAHTPKALRVLRSKVVGPLQPLCVSVLQNDKQSQDELQSSVKEIHLRLTSDGPTLDREAEQVAAQRKALLVEAKKARNELLDARQDETRDIVFAGTGTRPIEAAKRVKIGRGKDDWIPSPTEPGSACPLSIAEVAELYQSNATLSADDERELGCSRTNFSLIPPPKVFRLVIEELRNLEMQQLRLREELWEVTTIPDNLSRFEEMMEEVHQTIEFLREGAPWQFQAIQAGRDGEVSAWVWKSLAELIESTWADIQHCHNLVMEHGPVIKDPRAANTLLIIVDAIIGHSASGGSFGFLTRAMHRDWWALAEQITIGSRPLNISNAGEMKAVQALLKMRVARAKLTERWERQITKHGGPDMAALGEKPEHVCKQYVSRINHALSWHDASWKHTENGFIQIGFRWALFIDSTAPGTGENAELERIRRAVINDLAPILQSRRDYLRHRALIQQVRGWQQIQLSTFQPEAAATRALRVALHGENPASYDDAVAELERLHSLEAGLMRRRELVAKMSLLAPAWATAITSRATPHNQTTAPGPVEHAWAWRQWHDELERRAKVSISEIQERIERINARLMGVTARLIELRTWGHQIRQTSFTQRAALGAYSTMRGKLTKSGTGVRDAEFRAAARREMATAKDAVPVWIMPLSEVASNFDPRKTRFDVVIIDEASQCDPAGLFAIYLGKQIVVVGDDEQVTPVTVGQLSAEVSELIKGMLNGVPHKELYDGETSIYELAQISFGGVIRLTEHFRCAPDIISFSNNLSYKGAIQPLREAGTIPLRPNVVAHRIASGVSEANGVNQVEAVEIVSLICAAIRSKEYALNDEGEPTTFGVVSLVGSQQAVYIDTLLRSKLTPVEYHDHKLLCGDSAQFQGDERDVLFLSVVDAPPVSPPLSLRQEGPKKIFKKRFNVAASRARNQMWVVYSLNHEIDLQPGDFRRRIIEHAIDPHAHERDIKERLKEVDPNSKVFEGGVLAHLIARGYKVQPQYQAGAYYIDLVVIGADGKRLAVECDGEQFHGFDQIKHDVERQAVLERMKWKFSRIRGSLYFRDEERAMAPVYARLEELGIKPIAKTELATVPLDGVVAKLIREAQDIRRDWNEATES